MNLLIYGGLAYAGWHMLRTNYVRDFWNKCFKIFFETKYFDTIIDLGCGDAAYVSYLKKRCNVIIGIDIDPFSVFISNFRYDRVIKSNLNKIVLPDGCAVFCNQVLEHMSPEDGNRLMNEIKNKVQFAVVCVPVNPFNIDTWKVLAPFGSQHVHRTVWSKESFMAYGFLPYIRDTRIGQVIVAVFERGG